MKKLTQETLEELCTKTKQGIKDKYNKDVMVNWKQETTPMGSSIVVTIHGENVGDEDLTYTLWEDQHGPTFIRTLVV